MTKIILRSRVGKDGILNLDIPTEIKDAEVKVTVTIEAITDTNYPENLGWTPGFFDGTAGAWKGESLARESQCKYQIREDLF